MKKISLLLCVLLTAFCFTACSKTADQADYDREVLEMCAETIISGFSNFEDDSFQYYKEQSDFWLNNYLYVEIGLPISGEDFIGMMNAWQAAEEECGEYVSHGDFVVEVKSDGYVATAAAKYKNRNADISFTFDEKYNLKSLDVSAKYSLGEILTKAGLNTLLGMGTVFAVLILLAFLISLMKYIPLVTEWFEKKKNEKHVVDMNDEEEICEVLDETDDLELVAVITAAIAASEETSTDGFVVRSIKRRTSNNWM